MPLHERADERFVWNRHFIRELVSQPELAKFVLPVMLGCEYLLNPVTIMRQTPINLILFFSLVVQSHHCTVNRRKFVYTLISRRCCYRAGTRFFMRGVDQEGQVANYVETEQIIEYQGDKCSFIQVTINRNNVKSNKFLLILFCFFFSLCSPDQRIHSNFLGSTT